MATSQIFVSHSHHDKFFCYDLVGALRGAGADVWYDEHNMDRGDLMDTIMRELGRRPTFVLILSPAALASSWVREEAKWAWQKRNDRDSQGSPKRSIMLVTAKIFDPATLSQNGDAWLFLRGFKRIEASECQPYPQKEAIRHILKDLSLTPRGEAPIPVAFRPEESAESLIERGRALLAQERNAEALLLFQRAGDLAPRSFDVWSSLGYTYSNLKRYSDAFFCFQRALDLDPDSQLMRNETKRLRGW